MHVARRALLWAAGTIAYVAIARASLELATVHLSSSPVWPPAGFAIGLLVVFGLRLWPAVVVGAFVANWLASGDASISLLIATGNGAEALLAAYLIRRWSAGRPLDRISGVAAFLGAVAAGAVVSATVGTAALRADGLGQDLVGTVWQTWFMGNLGGSLIVAPLIMSARKMRWDALQSLGVGLAAGILAFLTTGWSLIILFPVLAWFCVGMARPALTTGLLGIATGTVAMTLIGSGPFWGLTANKALILLQLFLVGTSTVALTLAAGLRRRQERPTAASWYGALLALGPLLAATAFIGIALHPTIASLDDARQDDTAHKVLEAWEDAILDHEDKMTAMRGLYEAKPDLTRQEFDKFVSLQEWTFGTGGSTAIGFARVVTQENLTAYEHAVRQDMQLPDVVRQNFSVFPPSQGTVTPVDHVYPMTPAPGAIGFNLGFTPEGQASLDRAARSGLAIATEPVDINTPSGNFPGFFVSLPVYSDDTAYGFIVLAQTMRDSAPIVSGANYRMEDVTGAPILLHETQAGIEPTQVSELAAWGRVWQLSISVESTITGTESQAPWFILAGGLLLSIAMAAAVYAHDSTRARAHEMSRALVDQARVDAARVGEIKRLEDRDQFRRHFLNMVAHELRTPLTPIRTQAWLLSQDVLPQHEKSISILKRGVSRLSAVVDDLLVAAKLESDGMSLNCSEVDLLPIVNDAVGALGEQAELEGTKLVVEGATVALEADGPRIAQVVDNLLTNALKFAKGGNVTIRVARRGDEAVIEIEDDGIGVPPERIKEMGQPFVQVHDIQAVGVKGTGLGIYICKSIAKLHHGRLDIQSDGVGKGTTVTLRLPIK